MQQTRPAQAIESCSHAGPAVFVELRPVVVHELQERIGLERGYFEWIRRTVPSGSSSVSRPCSSTWTLGTEAPFFPGLTDCLLEEARHVIEVVESLLSSGSRAVEDVSSQSLQETLEAPEGSGIDNFDRLAFTARRLGETLNPL